GAFGGLEEKRERNLRKLGGRFGGKTLGRTSRGSRNYRMAGFRASFVHHRADSSGGWGSLQGFVIKTANKFTILACRIFLNSCKLARSRHLQASSAIGSDCRQGSRSSSYGWAITVSPHS